MIPLLSKKEPMPVEARGIICMGIFGSKSDKKKISLLEQENKQNRKRIKQLENLCEEKDSFFMELMADGLRHGSSLAAKHMSDRKKYKQGK